MNGHTTVNATLNPYTAAMDRATWGWPWLSISFYGRRLIYMHIGRLTVDVYTQGCGKTFTARGGGAGGSSRYWMLFWPLGKIQWVTHKANKGI